MRSRVIIEFTHDTAEDGSRHLFWLVQQVVRVLTLVERSHAVRVERDPAT